MNLAYAPIQALVYSSNTELYRAGLRGYTSTWHSLRRILVLIAAIGSITAMLVVLLRDLPVVLLGASYANVSQVLPLLAPLIVITGLHYALGDTLMGVGKQGIRASVQMLAAIWATVIYLWLIPQLSWHGAVIGSLASELLILLLLTAIYRRGIIRERTARVRALAEQGG
jgi:O-antigen/teichoic acid export membrane protein